MQTERGGEEVGGGGEREGTAGKKGEQERESGGDKEDTEAE